MPRGSKSKVSVLKVLPVFRPAMGQAEIDAVARVIRSGWIGLGPETEKFEKKFSRFVDSKYAVAVNSATAALHVSLLSLGIGKGDEVLVPSLTFVSDAHAILYTGARPIFVDIDEETLCMDPADLEKKVTGKSKAVIPVDFGGHPVDLDKIREIAHKHKLVIIEDASHACGAKYKGKMVGGLSDLTCFSFHAVKNLATGDGGMVTTNNKKLADTIRRLRWVGIDRATWEREEKVLSEDYRQYGWYYDVVELGYKYHMNDLTAALGLAQLKKLRKANRRREILSKRYDDHFHQMKWLKIPAVRSWAESARHNYVIRTKFRDKLNLFLKDKLISSGVHYMPIHQHKYYRESGFAANVPVTDRVWKTLLTLPLYPTLSFRNQGRVIGAVKNFEKQYENTTY